MTDPNLDPATTLYFSLEIDGVDVGTWATCRGLSVTLAADRHEAGGMGADYMHQLRGRLSYGNITLTRPVGPDTAKVVKWITTEGKRQKTTAQISALSPDGKTVCSWTLQGVVPVQWTGPDFDATSGGATAMETLEIAHEGFLPS